VLRVVQSSLALAVLLAFTASVAVPTRLRALQRQATFARRGGQTVLEGCVLLDISARAVRRLHCPAKQQADGSVLKGQLFQRAMSCAVKGSTALVSIIFPRYQSKH
jgi:hypothetical protein